MKTIKAQRLASTFTDSNGDRRDKRFLEEWVAGMPPRFPFGQHHDAALPTIGYIENFRLEEDLEHLGEWFVVGDVSVEDDFDWSKHGGFSYAIAEIARTQPNGEGVLYVPYPFYRDEQAIEEILSYDSQLDAGRWIKKGADVQPITLLVTFTLWLLTPVWKKAFDEKVWPFLERVSANYRKGRFKDMPFDYGSIAIGRNGEEVHVQFIPDRRNCEQTFTKELVKKGLEKAIKVIAEDKRGATVSMKLIKLYYHNQREGYRVTSIQYADGQETNIIENSHET
jgi:hypothetical protein